MLESLVFVTLGWAVLNLLPVRPFDGGHVLKSVLPGGERTRVRLASAISVVFALAVAAFAYERSTWTAGMFLLVAAMNLFSLLPSAGPARGRAPSSGRTRCSATCSRGTSARHGRPLAAAGSTPG